MRLMPLFARRLLLRAREAALEDQVQRGEMLVREYRARLHNTYRELRQVRAALAGITPAKRLLADALRRRAAEIGQPIDSAGMQPRSKSLPFFRM